MATLLCWRHQDRFSPSETYLFAYFLIKLRVCATIVFNWCVGIFLLMLALRLCQITAVNIFVVDVLKDLN